MNKQKLDIAVYVTATLLAISLFLPLTNLPVIGDVSYNRIADIESYIVIAFCVSAVGLLLADMGKFVPISAAGVWITLLFPAIENALKSDDGGFLSKAMNKASDAAQQFAAELFMDIPDFSWGGYVFLIALLAFTLFSVLRAFK